MDQEQKVALALYRQYVTDTGFDPPKDYATLLLFAEMSGATVFSHPNAPKSFDGIQIGEAVHLPGSPCLSDYDLMRRLAHEWCHYLRRSMPADGQPERRARSREAYLYGGAASPGRREREERIAEAFELLF